MNGSKQLWIGEELHKLVKIKAAKRGISMRDLVEKAVVAYLAASED